MIDRASSFELVIIKTQICNNLMINYLRNFTGYAHSKEEYKLRAARIACKKEAPFAYKQVIVIRTDLKLSRGKLTVQVAHAAVAAAEKARRYHDSWWKKWLTEGQKKVVVKVSTLENLLLAKEKATRARLPNELIRDRGLTEIPPATVTVLGIGPAPNEKIDRITGELPLL
jgi:PTH2 family peptidyl-tRNA hydrolase